MRGSLLVSETNCKKETQGAAASSSYNHNTLTTLRTSVKESLQMHFIVAVRNLQPGEKAQML